MRRSAVLLAALAVSACEWFSTMADGPGIQPHEREPLLPPLHAVPLDGLPEFDLTTADQALTRLAPADSASLAVGEATYGDFCFVCHGEGGRGGGPISNVFPAIPAINTDRVDGFTDAYIFALITKGRGLMPDYNRIPVAARWGLVDYVRSLPPGAPAGRPASAAPAGRPTGAAAAGDTTGRAGGPR
jgi:mono/diheme cytochrome c family protein